MFPAVFCDETLRTFSCRFAGLCMCITHGRRWFREISGGVELSRTLSLNKPLVFAHTTTRNRSRQSSEPAPPQFKPEHPCVHSPSQTCAMRYVQIPFACSSYRVSKVAICQKMLSVHPRFSSPVLGREHTRIGAIGRAFWCASQRTPYQLRTPNTVALTFKCALVSTMESNGKSPPNQPFHPLDTR